MCMVRLHSPKQQLQQQQQKIMKDISRKEEKRKVQTSTQVLAWHTCCLLCKTCQIQKTREKVPPSHMQCPPASIIYFYHHPSMQPSSTPFIFLLSSRARFTSSANTFLTHVPEKRVCVCVYMGIQS